MNVWGAIAGGFVGTLVLTTALSAGGEFGLTRMDLPFLLGTMVSTDRSRAKALGYAMHFVVGQLFALVYFGIFSATYGIAVTLYSRPHTQAVVIGKDNIADDLYRVALSPYPLPK